MFTAATGCLSRMRRSTLRLIAATNKCEFTGTWPAQLTGTWPAWELRSCTRTHNGPVATRTCLNLAGSCASTAPGPGTQRAAGGRVVVIAPSAERFGNAVATKPCNDTDSRSLRLGMSGRRDTRDREAQFWTCCSWADVQAPTRRSCATNVWSWPLISALRAWVTGWRNGAP